MKKQLLWRKTVACYLVLCLVLIPFSVAAQDEEAGGGVRGFVLFGLSRLYDGAERVRGGVQQLLGGNEEILAGLVTLEQGLAGPIAGGLTEMKSGIDGQMLPGLDSIMEGITGRVVPGLREMKSSLDGRVVPGLRELRDGATRLDRGLRDMRRGFTGKDQIIDGLELIRGGLQDADSTTRDISQGLGLVLLGLGDANKPLTIVGGLTVIRAGLTGLVSPGLSSAISTIGETTQTGTIQYDLEAALLAAAGNDAAIDAIEAAQGKLVAVRGGLTTARGNIDGQIVSGLNTILGGITHPTVGTGMIASLDAMKDGIDDEIVPGLDSILDGLNDKVVPGIDEMREGINEQMVPGLSELITGLGGDFSPGLGEMLTGFNRTEATHGESGIVEGLTKIREGLSSPVGEPGVSEGLGQVIGGIQGELLGGVNKLQEGVAASVIPGLEEMHTGIQGELQPGFTTVSWLLLAIWLVSVVVFLVIGILIGRSRRAKVSSGQSLPL